MIGPAIPLTMPGDLQQGHVVGKAGPAAARVVPRKSGHGPFCQAFFFMISATTRTTTATAMRMMLVFPMIGSLDLMYGSRDRDSAPIPAVSGTETSYQVQCITDIVGFDVQAGKGSLLNSVWPLAFDRRVDYHYNHRAGRLLSGAPAAVHPHSPLDQKGKVKEHENPSRRFDPLPP